MEQMVKWSRRVFGWTLLSLGLTFLLYIWWLIGLGFDLLPRHCSDFVHVWLWVLLPVIPVILVSLTAFVLIAGWVKSVRSATFPDRKIDGPGYFLLGVALAVNGVIGFFIAVCLLFVPARRRGRVALFLLIGEFVLLILLFCTSILAALSDSVRMAVLHAACILWVIFTVGFLVLIPLVSGVKLPGWQRCWAWGTAALGVFAVGLGQYAMFAADAKVEALKNDLHARYGVARTMAELKEVYFRSAPANAAFTEFVDNGKDFIKEFETYDFLNYFDPSMLKADSVEKLKFEEFLTDNPDAAARIDAIFANGPVRYDVDFTVDHPFNLLLPHSRVLRFCQKMYAARVRLALLRNDRAEAMRLHRLSRNVALSPSDGGNLLEVLVMFSLEQTRLQMTADMLASGILSSEDIVEIESDLLNIRSHLRPKLIAAYVGEAASAGISIDFFLESGRMMWEESEPIQVHNVIGAPIYCYFRNDHAFVLEHFASRLQLLDRKDFSRDLMDNADIDIGGKTRILSAMLMPSFGRSVCLMFRLEAQIDMGTIGCEIERFRQKNGRLPESLDELNMPDMPLDPGTGKPFDYRIGEFSTVVWGKSRTVGYTGYRLSGGLTDADGEKYEEEYRSFTVIDPGSAVIESEERHDDLMPMLPVDCDGE